MRRKEKGTQLISPCVVARGGGECIPRPVAPRPGFAKPCGPAASRAARSAADPSTPLPSAAGRPTRSSPGVEARANRPTRPAAPHCPIAGATGYPSANPPLAPPTRPAVLARPKHKVPVIGHQAEAKDPCWRTPVGLVEHALESIVVSRLFKERQPRHGPIERVVDQTSRSNPSDPWHAMSLSAKLPAEKSRVPFFSFHSRMSGSVEKHC